MTFGDQRFPIKADQLDCYRRSLIRSVWAQRTHRTLIRNVRVHGVHRTLIQSVGTNRVRRTLVQSVGTHRVHRTLVQCGDKQSVQNPHTKSATLLRRMSCSCRSGFRDAWMTSQNGCNLIVFNSIQPRWKCSGVHPFDVSIRFHSPVCVSALTSLFRPILSETSEYIWTVTSAWGLMSQRWCPAVSRCCSDSAAFVRRLRGQSLCRSSCHWFCLAVTTAMPHSPASRIGWWTDCGPCSTRLLGWSTLPVEPSPWHHSSMICTGFVIPIGSTTSWRSWSTDASMDWRRATSPTNSRACQRLCRDGAFGRLWRPVLLCLAFSGRHSAVVHSLWQQLKHGTAYRHMSHHLHRWRLSSAASRLSCSWDRTLKPDIGWCSKSLFWLCYVPSKSTLIYVTLIIFVIIIIIKVWGHTECTEPSYKVWGHTECAEPSYKVWGHTECAEPSYKVWGHTECTEPSYKMWEPQSAQNPHMKYGEHRVPRISKILLSWFLRHWTT